MRAPLHRYLAAVALAAISLTGTGCGGDDESPDPPKEPGVSQAEKDAVVLAARAYLENRDPGRCGLVATPAGVTSCRRYAQTPPVPDLSVLDASVSLETATVRFVAPARDEGSILMRKFRDEWRGEAVQGRDYQPRE